MTAPGLYSLEGDAFGRGLVAVTGRDAERWLDGMVTNDIHAISGAEPGGPNGCYAALLTPKGRIVADLHVLAREDGYWLETARFAVGDVIAGLEKYIVADDVALGDRSAEFTRLALEGPGARALLEGASRLSLDEVEAGCWRELSLAGTSVAAARFGWSGEDGWQLFVHVADAEAIRAVLTQAGAATLPVEDLEVRRIEAGVPRLGPELDEEVFPDEARLDAAISRTKGCYTGQEIVARLYSRGAVNHLLVALHFEGDRAPSPGATLTASGEKGPRKTGEVTSACVSPSVGPIGLGYVRKEHAELGTRLQVEDASGAGVATVREPRAGVG